MYLIIRSVEQHVLTAKDSYSNPSTEMNQFCQCHFSPSEAFSSHFYLSDSPSSVTTIYTDNNLFPPHAPLVNNRHFY